MDKLTMLTLAERKKLHINFWEGKLEKPLLGVFLPFDTAYPSIDIDLSCKDMQEAELWGDMFQS